MSPNKNTRAFLQRISTPNPYAFAICPILGCGRPSQARAGKGASVIHCDRCVRHKNRHGDFVKATYTATQFRPYRLSVERYLKTIPDDRYIAHAELGLEVLLEEAGPVHRVADYPMLRPEQKAKSVLARMKRGGVSVRRLLVLALAVSAIVKDDPIRPMGTPGEFRLMQLGKRCLRLRGCSGYHAVYGPHGRYDRYPRSAGLFVRCLGKLVEDACDSALIHLDTILEAKQAAFGAAPIPQHLL